MRNRIVLLFLLIMVLPLPARSSSVLQVNFTELVRSSEFIFEGRVVSKRAEMDARGVHTYVTFEVAEVLKGKSPGKTIVLRYLGGAAGGFELTVPDLVPPADGERGIYFVESLSKPPAHPLYGWDQGHFLVLKNAADNTDRIFSRNRRPIVGFDSATAKPNALSTGVASGLSVAESARSGNAVSASDFKKRVRQTMERR